MKKVVLFFAAALAFASCSTKLTEEVVATYPDGKTQKVQYCNSKGDCVKEVELYETGKVKMEGPMKGEKRDGEWTAYFEDGRVQSHGYFKDGLRTGTAEVFYSNGNKCEEGFYNKGSHCGKWKFYDEQGNLIKEVDYGECE